MQNPVPPLDNGPILDGGMHAENENVQADNQMHIDEVIEDQPNQMDEVLQDVPIEMGGDGHGNARVIGDDVGYADDVFEDPQFRAHPQEEEVGSDLDDMPAAPEFEQIFQEAENLMNALPPAYQLRADFMEPLYENSAMSKGKYCLLMNQIKVARNLSNVAMDDLYKLMKRALPEGNKAPTSDYVAKRVIGSLGLDYELIHACPNHHILYRGIHAELQQCPECGEPRYDTQTREPRQVNPSQY
jgi:hypothetical protein